MDFNADTVLKVQPHITPRAANAFVELVAEAERLCPESARLWISCVATTWYYGALGWVAAPVALALGKIIVPHGDDWRAPHVDVCVPNGRFNDPFAPPAPEQDEMLEAGWNLVGAVATPVARFDHHVDEDGNFIGFATTAGMTVELVGGRWEHPSLEPTTRQLWRELHAVDDAIMGGAADTRVEYGPGWNLVARTPRMWTVRVRADGEIEGEFATRDEDEPTR